MISETKKQLKQCPHCTKMIDSFKYPLHLPMCETLYQSRKSKFLETCEYCQQKFPQSEYNFHVNHSCKHRLVPCIDCEDMFPLSLFNQHLQVCRSRNPDQGHHQQNNFEENQQIQEQQEEPSAINNLILGIGSVGWNLLGGAFQVCEKVINIIQENKEPALNYLSFARTRLQQTLQDIIISFAQNQNAQGEGMSREQISKLPLTNFIKKQQNENCSICCCELQNGQVLKQLKCKHSFHPICIGKWLRINSTCPLCKHNQIQ